MKRFAYACLSLSLMVLNASNSWAQKNNWIALYNGKNFNGWDTYIGPPLDSTGKKLTDVPVGLNNDPQHVFTIVKQDGENIIRISGEEWGGIATKKEYADFHFQLQFKWGLLTWGQKRGKRKDSGLLYFATGDNGADYGAWMRSQEFQVEEGNCGDYWGVAGGLQDIPATKKSDSEYVYNAAGQLYAFSATGKTGRHCIKQGDAENATGQWNTLDLYCRGDTSVHVINGKAVMVLYHSRQLDNGKELPLTKGKFQIQSEGAEVFYKNIRVEQLDAIPVDFLR